MAGKGIDPIYMRQRDLKFRDVTALIVCQAMARIVGNSNVEGAQLINQIWRLYVKDKACRVRLLARRELLIVNKWTN